MTSNRPASKNAPAARKGTGYSWLMFLTLAVVALAPGSAFARQDDPEASVVWVAASDDGSPAFLYNSPHEGDRAEALDPGTALQVLGDEVEGDGQRWYPVLTPDGVEGYIAVLATTRAASR